MVAGRRSGNVTSRAVDMFKKTLNVLVISDQAVPGGKWEACLSARDYQIAHVSGATGVASLLQHMVIEVVVIDLASDPQAQSELQDRAFGGLYHPVDATALLSLIDAATHCKHKMREHGGRLAEIEAENRELKQLTQQLHDALAFTGYEWRTQITHLLLASNKLMTKAANVLNTEQTTAIERIFAYCRVFPHL
jgi:hypothetical protein